MEQSQLKGKQSGGVNGKQFPLIFLFAGPGLFLLVAALVFRNYFSLDEPNILWAYRTGVAWSDYYPRFVGEGRPLYGLFQIGGITLMGTLAKLKYLRLISILLTLLFCGLIFRFLRKKQMAPGLCWLVPVLIFCLPGFSVFMSWAQQYSHHLSSLLSFFSGMLLVKVYEENLNGTQLPRARKYVFLFAALLLQLISLINYQNSALSILLPVFFILFLHPHVPARNRIVFTAFVVITYFVFLAIYFKLFRWMLEGTNTDMTERGAFGMDIAGKLSWFMYVLLEASKLHLLLIKSNVLSYLLSAAIAGFLIRDVLKRRLLELFFLLFFSILVFLPHLLIKQSWCASRNFCLISVILSFYLVLRSFEVIRAPSVLQAVLISLPFIGMMCLNISEGWVKPQKQDYDKLSDFVNALPVLNKGSLIVEVIPPEEKIHEPQSLLRCYRDEFNASVFFPTWPIEPAIKIMYNDKHPGIPSSEIEKRLVVNVSPDGHFHSAVSDSVFQLNLHDK
jgi:hypothetical protein